MEKFVIEGGVPLSGTIVPAGNKNGALPIMAACLLTDDEVILRNVQRIRDVEAMALGIPVVTSNRGALPEVVGDAGLMVDAEDRRGLAAAIRAVLSDDARAGDLRRRGLQRAASFTWDSSAGTLYEAYTRLLGPR